MNEVTTPRSRFVLAKEFNSVAYERWAPNTTSALERDGL